MDQFIVDLQRITQLIVIIVKSIKINFGFITYCGLRAKKGQLIFGAEIGNRGIPNKRQEY
jgi:hypothetical protein